MATTYIYILYIFIDCQEVDLRFLDMAVLFKYIHLPKNMNILKHIVTCVTLIKFKKKSLFYDD